MKILIAGSTEFKNYGLLEKECINIISKEQYDREIPTSELEVVSGHAEGADLLGERFARKFRIKINPFPANWYDLTGKEVFIKKNKAGKDYNVRAGFNRNQKMIDYMVSSGGGIGIFFNMGTNGTKDCIKRSNKAGIKIYEIKIDKEIRNEEPHQRLASEL